MTSIIVSFVAVVFSITGLYLLNKFKDDIEIPAKENPTEVNIELPKSMKAIVLEKDIDSHELKLKLDRKVSSIFTFNPWECQELKVYDNQQKEITPDDIKLGDIIEISYYNDYYNDIIKDSVYEIHIIDSQVDKSLYGVIIVTNGERYKTYDDLPINDLDDGTKGIRFYMHKKYSWRHNLGMSNATESFTYETYKNNIVDEKCEITMDVYFDELKLSEDPVIGLVYSTGIEYVETLSPHYNTNREYIGEAYYEPVSEFLSHSEDVKYRIIFHRVFSFTKIEVYEYNMNQDLLGVTELHDWNDIFDYNVNKDALYAYFKVYSQDIYRNETFKTYDLNVGDNITVYMSDNHGLVWIETFTYS